MEKICKNCKHWDREHVLGGSKAADCNLIARGENAPYVQADSALVTPPDFGCTLWEEYMPDKLEDVKRYMQMSLQDRSYVLGQSTNMLGWCVGEITRLRKELADRNP